MKKLLALLLLACLFACFYTSLQPMGDAIILKALDERGRPFVTYSAEELKHAPGEFTSSAFVQEVTGVDSVCERAAVLASGGTLAVRKVAENGMTFALAKKEEGIRFE